MPRISKKSVFSDSEHTESVGYLVKVNDPQFSVNWFLCSDGELRRMEKRGFGISRSAYKISIYPTRGHANEAIKSMTLRHGQALKNLVKSVVKMTRTKRRYRSLTTA